MNTFKRKSLHAAVLAGLGAVGMAGTANAVHVNPDGLGSVLIYPYYTVRADGGGASTAYYDNYISIVNTTASTKAVKVRFLEGKNSREVLDFNLFLSPFDVWTGAAVRTADGGGVISVDKSCVVPNALFAEKNPANITSGSLNSFKNFAYVSLSDGGGTTLDRTREGYLEVIEMGDVTNTTATAAAKHNNANGTPANCAYFETNDPELVMTPQLTRPTGGLYGAMSLINVAAGTDYSYDSIALDQWSDTVRYTRAGALGPDIGQASPAVSNVFTGGGVVSSTWPNAVDAVSATITHSQVFNEWMLETNTSSGTDWIVTFPTKKLYVNVGTGAATAPFNANFNNGKSCDIFQMAFYNREELTTTTPVTVLPSPEPTILPTNNEFCYEANVLTFANSNMLGSTNLYNIDPTGVGRTGHAILRFNQAVQVVGSGLRAPTATTINGAAATVRYYGLPVIGIAIQDFANGNVGGVASNYGGAFAHKYLRTIAP